MCHNETIRGDKRMYFLIDEKLPSLNEVINKNRTNRYAGAKFKKEIEETIITYIENARARGIISPVGERSCEIRIYFCEKTKRRDVDNIQSSQKFILDALQKAGILVNDSRKYVKQIHHKVYDSCKDSVLVIIDVEE